MLWEGLLWKQSKEGIFVNFPKQKSLASPSLTLSIDIYTDYHYSPWKVGIGLTSLVDSAKSNWERQAESTSTITCLVSQSDLYHTNQSITVIVEKIIPPIQPISLTQRIGIISGVIVSIIFIILNRNLMIPDCPVRPVVGPAWRRSPPGGYVFVVLIQCLEERPAWAGTAARARAISGVRM